MLTKRNRVTFRVEGKQYEIYAPPGFMPTWRKFLEICERDRQSAGELIRIFVEGQVRGRDPGNPQRPLTAWAPGHRDAEKRQEQDFFAWLTEYADNRRNEVPYRQIVDLLREMDVPPSRRPTLAGELATRLTKAGVRVVR